MSNSNLVEITSRVLRELKGRSHDEIVSEMNKALSEIGENRVVSWDETRRNDDCSSYRGSHVPLRGSWRWLKIRNLV